RGGARACGRRGVATAAAEVGSVLMRPEHLSLLRDPSAPAVHPDGTWAVLAISRPDLEEDAYPSRLWRLDLDDGSLRPLTHGFRDTQPVMSPDGKHVAFIR